MRKMRKQRACVRKCVRTCVRACGERGKRATRGSSHDARRTWTSRNLPSVTSRRRGSALRERLRERRARLTRVEEERREGWWVVAWRDRERRKVGGRGREKRTKQAARERENSEIATGAIEIEESDNGGREGYRRPGDEDRDITIARRSRRRRREGNPGKMERLEGITGEGER